MRSALEKEMQEFFKVALNEIRQEDYTAVLETLELVNRSVAKALDTYCAGR